MTTIPIVTAIIIFLNGERYIEESIQSIFSQTYKHWELLLVDDGSTDESSTIARRYAEQYADRVFYLEHEGHQNRGMSASRNLGIQHARGEFIAFLDADDIWLPYKLEEQLKIFDAFPDAGMVYGKTLLWHSWTNKPEDSNKDRFLSLGVRPNALIKPPRLLLTLLEGSQAPTTCNAIVRKSVIEQVGHFEEEFRGMYEDQVFFSKVLLQIPVFVSDRCWAKYRQHSDSCYNNTVKDLEKARAARLIFLTWLKNYFQQQKMQSFYLWFFLLKDIALCQNIRVLQLWSNAKNSLMQAGRKFLPTSTRESLWLWIGRHL